MSNVNVGDPSNLEVDNVNASANIEPQIGSKRTDGSSMHNQESKRSKTCTSDCWNYFTKAGHNAKGQEVAKCNGCGRQYVAGGKSHGTSHLNRHIKVCPALTKFHDVGVLLMDHEGNVRSRKIDQMRIREAISMAIIAHDLPYSFVQYKWIRELHALLNPDVKHISRQTAVTDVLNLYLSQKEKFKQILSKIPGRICLTSDCWTVVTSEGYLCLTAHFVDETWKLNSKILAFCKMEPPHSGIELSKKVYDCLIDWGIEKKVFSITLDNASANDNMQDILKEKLSLHNSLICNGEFFHVRCCAHILNLIVQDGLKITSDALQKIRDSIKYVKSSEARMISFKECVDEVGGIDTSMGLRLDVPTRWNSTYAMLESGIRYRRAFSTLSLNDRHYKFCPSHAEWRRAELMCNFLEPFDVITNLISGSSYPTSNMYFSQISKIELLLKENMDNDDDDIRKMAQRMKGKFDKYWSDYNMILALASVLDPRMKFAIIEYSYSLLDPNSETCQDKVEAIKSKLYYIYGQYRDVSTSSSSNDIGVGRGTSLSFSKVPIHPTYGARNDTMVKKDGSKTFTKALGGYINFRSRGTPIAKSELDYYLEEAPLEPQLFPELDVLNFWKTNKDRFPILSRMACDILSIPITTVASESAFSIGSRVLTKYRSSLLPDNVQALICTRSWLLGFETNDDDGENDDDLKIDIHPDQEASNVIFDE